MNAPSLFEVRAACVAVTKAAARVNAELVFTAPTTAAAVAGAVRPHLGPLREALQAAERTLAAADRLLEVR